MKSLTEIFNELIDYSANNYTQLSLIYEISDRYNLIGVKQRVLNEISKIRKNDKPKLNNLFSTIGDLFDKFSSQNLTKKQQQKFIILLFRKQTMSSIFFFLNKYKKIDPFGYLYMLDPLKYHHLTPYLYRAPYMKNEIVCDYKNQTFLFYVKKLDDFKTCLDFGMNIEHMNIEKETVIYEARWDSRVGAKTLKYLLNKIDSKHFCTHQRFLDICPSTSKAKNIVIMEYAKQNPKILNLKISKKVSYKEKYLTLFQSLFVHPKKIFTSKELTNFSFIVESFILFDKNLLYQNVKCNDWIKNICSYFNFDTTDISLLHLALLFQYDATRFNAILINILIEYDHSIIFYRKNYIRNIIKRYKKNLYRWNLSEKEKLEIISNLTFFGIMIYSCNIPSLKTMILSNFYNPIWKSKINIPKYYPKMLFYNENNKEKETKPKQLSLKENNK